MYDPGLVGDFCHKKDVWTCLWGGPWLGRVKLEATVVFDDVYQRSPLSARSQFRLSYWLLVRWSLLWLVEFLAAFTAHVCCMWTSQHLFFFRPLLSLVCVRTLCVITVTFYTVFWSIRTSAWALEMFVKKIHGSLFAPGTAHTVQ